MSLAPGTRLGVYEVTAQIGEGGMGQVYRARDTTLNRDVALKALPDAFASDPERLARFTREAQTLASLNHPNIAHIHGLEGSGGVRALIMELVDGEDLSQRIARRAISLDDVLPIAKQITEALEAAHEQGIVHRDLKPANIKVRPDGTVKVLDFGLAKAMEGSGIGHPGSPHLANSPTMTSPAMTMRGTILGTAAYMSPEQAKGMPVDHRSDVFSFGSVLYELVTGRQAFPGETAHDILASVIAREPDWTALPTLVDPRVTSLLRRCLAKSRRQRWQAIGDVRAEIEFIVAEPVRSPAPATAVAPPRPLWRRTLPIAATALVAGALAGWGAWTSRPSPKPPIVVRFQIAAGAESALQTNFNRQVLAVSPDGNQIVFSGDRVYLRSVSDAAPHPIAGTEGLTSVTHPAFSPDGRSLVFWAASDRTLKRITFGSTAIATLCPLSEGGLGLAWVGDHIYFADAGQGIKRVSANGGHPEVIVPVTGREEAYGPQLLPDGDTIMFTLGTRGMTSWDQATIVVQSLRTKERKTLVEGATDARYLPTGHLIFGRGGVLLAVPLDLKQQAIVGEPIAVVEGVRRAAPGTTGATHVAVSANGTLAYLPGPVSSSGASLQLAMFDRSGVADPLSVPLGPYSHPRVSPDGTRVAVGVDDGKELQVWIYGLSKSSAARRLTFGGNNQLAEWSADGQRVAFQSTREGDAGIWWQRADGTDTATRLTRPGPGVAHVPQSFSPDGRHLLFDEIKAHRTTLWDLSIADRKVTSTSLPDSQAPTDATFSPDGRWVAYAALPGSPATAIVYVEPYPPTGARYQISKQSEDGHHAVWSRDGNELFYTPGPGNRLLGVPIATTPTFGFGEPVLIPRPFVNAPPSAERTYDVTGNNRFLGLRIDVGPDGQPLAPQVQVVLNWFEELKQRVPIK